MLTTYTKLLDTLKLALEKDSRSEKLVLRYASLVAARRRNLRVKNALIDDMVSLNRVIHPNPSLIVYIGLEIQTPK